MVADIFGRMGEVEFDGPTAARLQVDEQRPVLRGEHVARMRLAVQQLLDAAAFADRTFQIPQRVAEQFPVRVGEFRSAVAVRHELSSPLHPIHEVRHRDVEPAHAGVQPLERGGVVGR